MSQTHEQPSAPNPALAYENHLVPAMFNPLAEAVLERAQPSPWSRVLDLACGTGIIARRAAPLLSDGGTVTGLDQNPDMLAVARSVSDGQGLSIEWREGTAEELPFPDENFDWVYCQQGLQFVPEKPRALREVHRVLVDGGRVAIVVWQRIERHPLIEALNQSLRGQLGVDALLGPFSLGDEDQLRNLLSSGGFREIVIDSIEIIERFPGPDHFVDSAVAGATAAVPEFRELNMGQQQNMIATVKEEMKPKIDTYVVDDVVEMPGHAFIALGTR